MKTLFTLVLTFWVGISSLQAQGDLGNGYYQNPIVKGDYPDPTIIRDGDDYYMTHSAFDYLPGLTVFHSQDLVNWKPISYALKEYLGSVWAPDITKYKDKYYIYFTVSNPGKFDNYVVWADSPYGTWSDPIDLKTGNIDPCHVVGEDGTRWMFLSDGKRVQLADDGLSTVGEVEKVYDGWHYPSDWEVECFCLEGPKLKYVNGYYYYLSAQGGTAGPPTAHMVAVARSKSIHGPWENSPYNPISRTWSGDEHWWNKGHGSLIDTPDGKWYMFYHAYENGFVNLGRQTLMEPIEWTNDGWFRIPEGIKSDQQIKKPFKSKSNYKKQDHLKEFGVGSYWKFYKEYDPTRFSVKNDVLIMKGKSNSPNNSSPLMFVSGDHAYEMEVEIEIEGHATAGLVLYYNTSSMVGMGFNQNGRYSYQTNNSEKQGDNQNRKKLWLRLTNDNHHVTGSYSLDGVNWIKENWSMEVADYNHNKLWEFQSLLPGVFVSGDGQAKFKKFRYRIL